MALAPLVFVTALLHAYIGWRVLPGLSGHAVVQGVLAAVLLASVFLTPAAVLGSRGKRSAWSDVLSWAGLLLMGLFSTLLVLTVVRDVALLVLWLASLAAPGRVPMAMLAADTALAVPLLGALVTLLGFWNARRTAAVVRVDVPIKGLPRALQGFTIAQVSDIHVGPTVKKAYLQRIVDKVNALEPDVVAITGDLVDGKVADLSAHVAPLASLRSRHGSFFVTGNHEYYSGAHAWIDELHRLGVRVLMNEHVVLYHGARALRDAQDDSQAMAPLVLAGVTDYGAHHFDPSHRSDPQAALDGAPPAAPVRVLLAHQPRTAVAAADAGFDLQLSGHTHGGQFYPWNLFVRFQQPFTAGLHKLKDMWVYTSRGTGYWGPPKRFGAPSEITLIRLVTA